MISEPKLPLDNLPDSVRPSFPAQPRAVVGSAGRSHFWFHRLWVLLFVFVCATAGVLLLVLPWRPEWTDNSFMFAFPWLRAFMTSGFVRGVCSGLGVLDIWIGFSMAIHYHEDRHP